MTDFIPESQDQLTELLLDYLSRKRYEEIIILRERLKRDLTYTNWFYTSLQTIQFNSQYQTLKQKLYLDVKGVLLFVEQDGISIHKEWADILLFALRDVYNKLTVISLKNFNANFNLNLSTKVYQKVITCALKSLDSLRDPGFTAEKVIESIDFPIENSDYEKIIRFYNYSLSSSKRLLLRYADIQFTPVFSEGLANYILSTEVRTFNRPDNVIEELDLIYRHPNINSFKLAGLAESKLRILLFDLKIIPSSDQQIDFEDVLKVNALSDFEFTIKSLKRGVKNLVISSMFKHFPFTAAEINKSIEMGFDLSLASHQNISTLIDSEGIEGFRKIRNHQTFNKAFMINKGMPKFIHFTLMFKEFSDNDIEEAIIKFLNHNNEKNFEEVLQNLLSCKRFLISIKNLISSSLKVKTKWNQMCAKKIAINRLNIILDSI